MIKCVAVDDSPLALRLLEDYIHKVNFLTLEYSFTNAIEAAGILRRKKAHLLFLDIQMPDISGISLLGALEYKPKVIFTTAYPDYAVEGFNLDAVDYLLKPFSFERFFKAVSKAKEQLNELFLQETEADAAFIFVRSGYETVKIVLNDIMYIEALKDYVQIFTVHKKIVSLMGMKEILAGLPGEEFVRVHRSYIIPLSKVTRITSRKVYIGEKEIPLGESFRKEFFAKVRTEKRISGL